ncbi:MAG: hypothetical protein AAGG75_12235 [Bacteroidota bacterium]
MQKSNLVHILKQFSRRDWRELGKMVRSSYFNQREDVVRLFSYLEQKMKTAGSRELEREKVFRFVFKKETFDQQKLRYTTSFLFNIVKRYLIQVELEADKIQAQQYLYRGMRKKGLEVFFTKELSNTTALLEKGRYRDSHFYLKNYQLGMDDAISKMPQRRIGAMNFQSIGDFLNISYLSSMLRLSCNIQSHGTISGQVYDVNLLKEVLSLIQSGQYIDIPAVALYYRCYQAIEFLKNGDLHHSELNFNELKMLINRHWKLFPPSEIRDIYLFTINYCIKRLNAGDKEYIREAFELFRSGLENETLLEEGFISSFTYKNITRLGVALKEHQWVEQFLENYKNYLHPRIKDNAWRYNLAFFFFQQEKYKSAMQLLVLVEFKDTLNNLDARRMLLKSYFELGEYDALDSLLDSFSRYINRQKELGYHKDNYLNLIRFVKKVIHTNEKEKLKELKADILNTSALAEKEWLLEKI